MTDAAPQWQGLANGIVYSIMFEPVLDRQVVERLALMIHEGRVLPGGVAAHVYAIRGALAAQGALENLIPTAHGADETRDFLSQLVLRLESRHEIGSE